MARARRWQPSNEPLALQRGHYLVMEYVACRAGVVTERNLRSGVGKQGMALVPALAWHGYLNEHYGFRETIQYALTPMGKAALDEDAARRLYPMEASTDA